MSPPSISQQWALGFAPVPFAVVSAIASSYVIYHLLFQFQEPGKQLRLYHRLVLPMNVALILYSFGYILGRVAVPEGTPYYPGAKGTVATCTARGFIHVMFLLMIPIYYTSLALQACMGIRNNFVEHKYKWIEKWIHIVAWSFPTAVATVFASTENLNPSGTSCGIAKSPLGCDRDPAVPCERGEDISIFLYIVMLGQAFLYLILPPAVIGSLWFWLKKIHKRLTDNSRGMSKIREAARKNMIQSAHKQISIYLFSFWSTWVFGLIWFVYHTLTGDMVYGLLIFANCMMASQGYIFAAVYFILQKMGRPRVESFIKQRRQSNTPKRRHTTVSTIRSNAESKSGKEDLPDAESFIFNIFDGSPDEDSPWAKFIDPDEYSSGHDVGDDDGELELALSQT